MDKYDEMAKALIDEYVVQDGKSVYIEDLDSLMGDIAAQIRGTVKEAVEKDLSATAHAYAKLIMQTERLVQVRIDNAVKETLEGLLGLLEEIGGGE